MNNGKEWKGERIWCCLTGWQTQLTGTPQEISYYHSHRYNRLLYIALSGNKYKEMVFLIVLSHSSSTSLAIVLVQVIKSLDLLSIQHSLGLTLSLFFKSQVQCSAVHEILSNGILSMCPNHRSVPWMISSAEFLGYLIIVLCHHFWLGLL